VEWAQPNYLYQTKQVTPNDPSFNRQWNLTAIDMPRAWNINPGGDNSVVVAVIDSGVTSVTQNITWPLWDGTAIRQFSIPYRINPDLNSTFTAQRDFVFLAPPNNTTVLDMNGHGTHVAGTIAQATNNSLGLAGVAYNVRLMPIKACLGYWDRQIIRSASGVPGYQPPTGCSFPTDATTQAIRYAADQGAKVINLSLGGPGAAPAYRDALQYAVGRGVFVAIAMGNEFEEGNPTEYPAFYSDIEGVMAVGAVGRSLRRSYYSNTGAHNEIAAPGGDVRDGGNAGLIFQTAVDQRDYDEDTVIVPRFDRYVDTGNQGTSMATPHVAAFAALLMSQGITNPAAVEAAIKYFARDLGAAGRDSEYGYGLIQPAAALRGLGLSR
jgi:serine protease